MVIMVVVVVVVIVVVIASFLFLRPLVQNFLITLITGQAPQPDLRLRSGHLGSRSGVDAGDAPPSAPQEQRASAPGHREAAFRRGETRQRPRPVRVAARHRRQPDRRRHFHRRRHEPSSASLQQPRHLEENHRRRTRSSSCSGRQRRRRRNNRYTSRRYHTGSKPTNQSIRPQNADRFTPRGFRSDSRICSFRTTTTKPTSAAALRGRRHRKWGRSS